MKKFKGESALILTTLLWGGTFAIVKEALNSGSPMEFLSLRFTFASILILPFVFNSLRTLKAPAMKDGIILGLFYFAGFATQTLGLKYTTVTKSAFITGTFVVFTPMFQMIIEKRKPGKGSIIGVVLVTIGLFFLASKGDRLIDLVYELGSNFNFGDFLTLLCAVFYSVYIVYLDIVSKRNDYMPLVFLQIVVTAIGALLFAAIFSVTGFQKLELQITSTLVFAILYTSIFATIITTTLQTKYQKLVTPSKAAIIISTEPIFASIIAYFLINEQVSGFGLIGCIFIFSGILISELMYKNE